MIFAICAATAIGLFAVYFSVRYAWWRPPVDERHPRILMYHMVAEHRPKGRFNKLRVPPAAFERQLRHLVEHGWRFAFLSELADAPPPPKTVVLTFDDGFRDNYLAAHPLLDKYGAKATLFLVVDRFDRDWSTTKKAHHNSGELMREEKLHDAELRAMLDSGRWELGSHTLTHALLPALPAPERQHEIDAAKASIEAQFGTEVASFAYPFGLYGQDDVDAVAKSGYRLAVTTEPGISDNVGNEALTLKRVKVSGKEGMLGFTIRLRSGRRGLLD